MISCHFHRAILAVAFFLEGLQVLRSFSLQQSRDMASLGRLAVHLSPVYLLVTGEMVYYLFVHISQHVRLSVILRMRVRSVSFFS